MDVEEESALQTNRFGRSWLVACMALVAAMGAGATWWTGTGSRLESPRFGVSIASVQLGVPTIIPLPLKTHGGAVTLESVRLAKPIPGLEVSFQVSQGPCPAGTGMHSLPAGCNLRPAHGATITPGSSQMLILTYILNAPDPTVTDDVVIDYRDGWHHNTTHNRTPVCLNQSRDTNPACP